MRTTIASPSRGAIFFVGVLACAALSCGDSARAPSAAAPDPSASPKADEPLRKPRAFPRTIGPPERPALLFAPDTVSPGERPPLYILLHGYLDKAAWMIDFVRSEGFERRRGALVVVPQGRRDWTGQRYWASGSACCNFHGASEGDDEALLVSLIDQGIEELGADPERVYIVGFSNGGFMAYTMACRHAERLAGVAVLNGSSFIDPTSCSPSAPVHVLHVHSTGDPRIEFGGGELSFYGGEYPGVLELLSRWAEHNECRAHLVLDGNQLRLGSGDEPDALDSSYRECQEGSSVRLWELRSDTHKPDLRDDVLDVIADALDGAAAPRGR